MSQTADSLFIELTPESRTPQERPPQGTLFLVVKDDNTVVLRNYLGEESASLGTAPDAG